MDSASDIDSRSIADEYGYANCNRNARGDSYSVCDCDTDPESDSNSNCHRFFDVISHRDEHLRSHRHSDAHFDRDDDAFLHTPPYTDSAALSHT